MQAVILVGGRGTRLQSVVKDVPKPMADVNGKPFLDYLVRYLRCENVDNIILATGYMSDVIETYFSEETYISCVIEKEALGTAGAVKNAEASIVDDSFIMMNGDTYFMCDYKKAYESHIASGADITMILRHVDNASRYGRVICDDSGRIISFLEKENIEQEGLINGGIYFVNKSVLELIPKDTKYSFETELMPSMLSQGSYINAYIDNGYFIDIGIPDDYYRFNNDIEKIQNGD